LNEPEWLKQKRRAARRAFYSVQNMRD